MTGNVLTFRKHSENLLIFLLIYCIIGARWWKVEQMCGKVVEKPLKWRKETQIGSPDGNKIFHTRPIKNEYSY